MATLTIPSQLSTYTGGKNVFELSATQLADGLDRFAREYNLSEVFYNDDGALNKFIRVFVNKKLIQQSSIDELKNVSLNDNSQVLIQTAFSGG